MTFVIPVLSAVTYALVGYAANYAGPDPTDVDWMALIATLAVGAVIGIGFLLGGVEITQESVLAAIAANIGVVYVVKKFFTVVWARVIG